MKKIILDCDPGVDDVLAIIVAIKSKEIKIEGSTTVQGNCSLDQASKNAQRVVDYFGKNIP